jgi:hypothetical protein
MSNPQNRTVTGKFGPGNKANPGGRPKTPQEVKDAFRAHTHEAKDVLVEVMRDKGAKPSERTKAAEVILNRAWGTPEQAVSVTGSLASMTVDTSKLAKADQDALLNAIVGIYGNNEESPDAAD